MDPVLATIRDRYEREIAAWRKAALDLRERLDRAQRHNRVLRRLLRAQRRRAAQGQEVPA